MHDSSGRYVFVLKSDKKYSNCVSAQRSTVFNASVLSIASIFSKESAESIEYSAGTEDDLQLDSTFKRTGIEMESFYWEW